MDKAFELSSSFYNFVHFVNRIHVTYRSYHITILTQVLLGEDYTSTLWQSKLDFIGKYKQGDEIFTDTLMIATKTASKVFLTIALPLTLSINCIIKLNMSLVWCTILT